MADMVSILIGAGSVIGFAVLSASYYGAVLRGRLSAIESKEYVSTSDLQYAEAQRNEHVEDARRERVRDVESTNTSASINTKRPVVEQPNREDN